MVFFLLATAALLNISGLAQHALARSQTRRSLGFDLYALGLTLLVVVGLWRCVAGLFDTATGTIGAVATLLAIATLICLGCAITAITVDALDAERTARPPATAPGHTRKLGRRLR